MSDLSSELSKHTWPYVLGTVSRPSEASEPFSAAMWDANNEVIITVM
jgi:hypothetical protein